MSVTASLTLPAQPASGQVDIRPLGGNGYVSPQSFYLVNINLVSDASGGTNTITVNLDPQYQGVISLMQTRLLSAAADRIVRLTLAPEIWAAVALSFSVQGTQVVDSDVGSNLMFSPPPLFDSSRAEAIVDNVDTETFTLRMLIYNFKRDAFQKVPLNVLLASLPRGFDIQ